jgi:ParB family chromosome partitioning protein
MQPFSVKDLIPHPKNEFYFDEMTGQKWEEFLESVRTSGVIEPPVVTDKRVIVSGHQRIRACKELGIETINCEVRIYENEDRVLKDLIETNIRQRGTIAGSDMKTSRILNELERIYGVKKGRGGDTTSNPHLADCKSQEQLAQENGMSVDKWNRLKKLEELPPEYQEMLLSGRISTKTVVNLIAKLSEEEQQELLHALPATEKITQAVAQQYIDQIKGLTATNATLAQEAADATRAVKASTDSEEYLRMQERLKKEEEKARDNYEKWQAEKKKNEGKPPKPDVIKEAEKKAEERVKKEYRKLTDSLEQKITELENRPEPDPEVIEVAPPDYDQTKRNNEILSSENADLKARLESLVSDQNLHVVREISSNCSDEEMLNDLYNRMLQKTGVIVTEFKGFLVSASRFERLTLAQRETIAERSQECIEVISTLLTALTTCKGEAA